MGFTNIRYPDELLKRAGGENFETAVMPEFGRGIALNGHFFEQEELDSFADLLRHHQKDVWLRRSEGNTLVAGQADNPIDRPSVYTSSGLKSKSRHSVLDADEQGDSSPVRPKLAFVLIVRGRSAALCSKVRIFYTLQAASAAMFEELLNGYSTVFSAAMLRADVGQLSDGTRELRKADTIKQLYDSEQDQKLIGIFCGGERLTF